MIGTVFGIVVGLVSSLTPAHLEMAEACQAFGGSVFNADTRECVVVNDDGDSVSVEVYEMEEVKE